MKITVNKSTLFQILLNTWFLSTPATGKKISKYEMMEMAISSTLVIILLCTHTVYKINDTHL